MYNLLISGVFLENLAPVMDDIRGTHPLYSVIFMACALVGHGRHVECCLSFQPLNDPSFESSFVVVSRLSALLLQVSRLEVDETGSKSGDKSKVGASESAGQHGTCSIGFLAEI